jgi:hypothetical protein
MKLCAVPIMTLCAVPIIALCAVPIMALCAVRTAQLSDSHGTPVRSGAVQCAPTPWRSSFASYRTRNNGHGMFRSNKALVVVKSS